MHNEKFFTKKRFIMKELEIKMEKKLTMSVMKKRRSKKLMEKNLSQVKT